MIDGFTFEIDGDPVLVERLYKALGAEYAVMLRENVEPVWLGIPPRAYVYSPPLPIKGRLTLRGPEILVLPDPTCPQCGRDLHGYRGPLCRYCDPHAYCE